MIDDVFSAADVITCPEVLGVRLRPLSIWHSWALKAIESPMIEGGKFDLEHVINAVLICSLDRETHAELCAVPDALAVYKGEIAAEYLGLSQDQRDAVLEVFGAYLNDCTVFPEFYAGEGFDATRDRLRCPSEWHLVASLLASRICQTEAEAWDYPIARAQCWQAVEGERRGSKAYVDRIDRQQFAELEDIANG